MLQHVEQCTLSTGCECHQLMSHHLKLLCFLVSMHDAAIAAMKGQWKMQRLAYNQISGNLACCHKYQGSGSLKFGFSILFSL